MEETGVGAALLMGLLGSAGHCVGMCGGVVALLERALVGCPPWALHAGRLTTYGALGALAGVLGQGLTTTFGVTAAQGALSLLAALAAVYFALVLWGVVPSPDRLLPQAARLWRRLLGRVLHVSQASPTRRAAPESAVRIAPRSRPTALSAYGAGLLWGLLPCGFVWMALPLALATGSIGGGVLTMVAFGLGTLPALLVVRLVLRRGFPLARWAAYRRAAAVVVLLVGMQLALRGLSAWGLVEPLRVGGLRLW